MNQASVVLVYHTTINTTHVTFVILYTHCLDILEIMTKYHQILLRDLSWVHLENFVIPKIVVAKLLVPLQVRELSWLGF